MADADEEYFVPLTDQRVFGAGIKRKRIAFVPAGTNNIGGPQDAPPTKSSAADRYLSIVLPKDCPSSGPTPRRSSDLEQENTDAPALCAICKQSVSLSTYPIAVNTHESSIAHQVCLEHSHPPSHLDREHVGLRYLKGYGWDPDSRKGLGARQEGIRIPVKAKEKNDTVGLREQDDEEDEKQNRASTAKKPEPVVRLDAGKVRKQELQATKRAEKLRETFYGPDLEQYLGPGG